jgi:hypothetical protein
VNHKHLRLVYWTVTLLFAVLQGWSAVQYLTEAPRMAEALAPLGYPTYFTKMLGIAKLLGIAAIVYGRVPTLKEWAYAGFTLDTLAAFFSHLAVGASLWIACVPLLFCAAQLASYFMWKRLDAAGDVAIHSWAHASARVPPSRPRPA